MEKIQIVSLEMKKDRDLIVKSKNLSSPKDAYEIIRGFLENKDREYFMAIALDCKNNINHINTVSIGTLNTGLVHPREVFKFAILANAANIILAHNHPSGNPTPSKEDINITNRLVEGGKILGIEVIDHIIVGDDEYISLKQKGII